MVVSFKNGNRKEEAEKRPAMEIRPWEVDDTITLIGEFHYLGFQFIHLLGFKFIFFGFLIDTMISPYSGESHY